VGCECDFWRLEEIMACFIPERIQRLSVSETPANTTKGKKKKRLTQGPKWNKTQNKKTQTPKKTQRRDMRGYYPHMTCNRFLIGVTNGGKAETLVSLGC